MSECAFEIVVFDFVEAIHVELPDKAVNLIVPEVFGQNQFFQLNNVLDDELNSVGCPIYNFLVLLNLNKWQVYF